MLLKLEIFVELFDYVQLVFAKVVLLYNFTAFSTKKNDVSVDLIVLVLLLIINRKRLVSMM